MRVDYASTADGTRRIPPVLEANVYRIVQEALANVAKHAKASNAAVALDQNSNSVAVTVTDDGVGTAMDRGFGMGLADMRERTELLGGRFRMKSEPGTGTAIHVEIPIRVTRI